jgi:signal transduction histidine kinase
MAIIMLNRIHQATLKFLTSLSIKQTYRLIVEEAVDLVEAQYGTLHVLRNGEFRITYSTAPRNMWVVPRRRGFVWHAIKSGKPKILSHRDIADAHPNAKVENIRSLVIIPLTYRNFTVGAITLRSTKKKHFNDRRIDALSVFGTIATLALRKTVLNTELRTALAGRDMFISVAAHELKTPITIISGYLQLLGKERPHLRHPDWFDTLQRETRRLSALVNEFLVVQQKQLESWQMAMEVKSLSVVVRQTVESFKISAKNRQFIFSDFFAGEDDSVRIDEDRIRESLINVINNAIKYSHVNSVINVWVGRRGDFNYVAVADKGRGIAKEDLPKIYNKFYRGSSDTKGFGLGLYLVRNIIRKHDAKISVKSSPGQGTTVSILFPRLRHSHGSLSAAQSI